MPFDTADDHTIDPSVIVHDGPFQLTLAQGPTRHSLYLPESSPRYRAIKSQVGAGALLEICPDAAPARQPLSPPQCPLHASGAGRR